MADNEQRTAHAPAGSGRDSGQNSGRDSGRASERASGQDSGQDAPPRSGNGDLGADVPRAPAGLQDPPADPGEPMNPA